MRPRIIFVVAHDRAGIMGRDGTLPWHLPADLKQFRARTLGKPVIMGRKTYESIGKPLPGRRNVVLTRDFSFAAEGVEIANSIQDVFEMTRTDEEIAIIGGSEIFAAFAPYVDVAFVTEIDANLAGNVRYEEPRRDCAREVLARHEPDDRNAYPMTFVRYDYS